MSAALEGLKRILEDSTDDGPYTLHFQLADSKMVAHVTRTRVQDFVDAEHPDERGKGWWVIAYVQPLESTQARS